MRKKNYRKKYNRRKIQNRKDNSIKIGWIVFFIFCISLVGTGFYFKQKIQYYYSLYFNPFQHKQLKNSKEEEKRINKIIGNNAEKIFGIDISHYQELRNIKWDSLSIGNKIIPIQFVIMRASMGTKSKDKNFHKFWKLAKEHRLIRGAYHFYRPDEDPILQANNFIAAVTLEKGDLVPVLDIEKKPIRISEEQLIQNLKIWLNLVEKKYGGKPIVYTFFHYKKDLLKDHFKDYPLWLANYNDVPIPSPDDDWDIWQFTENGIVYGINTKVDLNVYNGKLWSLKQLTID